MSPNGSNRAIPHALRAGAGLGLNPTDGHAHNVIQQAPPRVLLLALADKAASDTPVVMLTSIEDQRATKQFSGGLGRVLFGTRA